MTTEMPKAYEAKNHEEAIYQAWLDSGYFNPDLSPNKESAANEGEVFSMVLPPPNVTGTLHMGHATMLAIQDAMARFARLTGKRTLWLPGTDHAAIATQSKVEKLIKEKEGKSRHDLGREEFLKRVEQFAQESHDTIINQCKKMGSSLDWSREAYTLDEARNRAVNVAFKRMYEDGLIYRGNRVINWDPIGQTTIADDEIVYKEVEATLYTFKYSKDFPIAISTTRPETKVGDAAVAVHPEDTRYTEFVGKTYKVDFAGANLTIKVIADDQVDPNFGTGALGVTPAHSAIDFEMAKKNDLPVIAVINEEARMTPLAGNLVAGKTTLEARQIVADWVREQGLMISEDKTIQNLSTAERTGGVVEPLPKLQWFVDVNKEFEREGKMVTLKGLMQEAVRSKAIEILPDRFEKTYFHWIDNLRDWCISRQIWFGHRVPVWYRPSSNDESETIVGEAPSGDGWIQDSDTLDTWFSSGLWTFSTLGWPSSAEASEGRPDITADDFKRYHPTSVLETGYDILFFWVARMILMSTYLVNDVPFKTVYLHGLVRDEQGRKMSKSLGNIIDPLTMIEKYGADATRLSLIIGGTPGNDMKLSEEKIAGFRNFTNKLWNISRFVLMTVGEFKSVKAVTPVTLSDRWILARLDEVIEKVTELHHKYQLSLAGEILRDFTWNDFADWYLEIAKIEKGKEEILNYVLERILIMWHPFMPFVTEEIYKGFDSGLLMVAKWPTHNVMQRRSDGASELASDSTRSIESQFSELQAVVTAVRNLRAEYKVEQKANVSVMIEGGAGEIVDAKAVIEGLTRSTIVDRLEGQTARAIVGSITVVVGLAGLVDTAKEKERLSKELTEITKYITGLKVKLENADFVARAPEAVIAVERQKLAEAEEKNRKIQVELANLV